LTDVPEQVIQSFAGTGNPFSLGKLRSGEQVVDVGCGAGIDSFIAARMVGPYGYVIGVDMTPAMLKKARRAQEEAGLSNLEFRFGYGESLPVPDGWADVVISNGMINLMPDKAAAFAEMARVLKPGGRLQIADIVVEKAVPISAKCNVNLWTGCIAGALLESEYRATVLRAGFVDFKITWRKDVFSGAPQASSAASFGTTGINFRAHKAANEAEWMAELEMLNNEAPSERQVSSVFEADSFYDAGDLGCAYGPLDEIAHRMRAMAPEQTLEIRATDPSVTADLRAWCRLRGHQFVAQQEDHYLIRRK
jgi:TusA-related sulfurtransferase/precorrin-6B methylase 2